jgi:MFS transporter, CP family, cyanate transporter
MTGPLPEGAGAEQGTGGMPAAGSAGSPAAGQAPANKPDAGATGSGAAPRSLWRGRILLIVGIVLLGISLRHAVTGMSPFLPQIQADLGMGNAAATVLGMLPTLFFGAAGFTAPVLIRRTSLELTAVLAMVLAALGTGLRPILDSVPVFLVLSAVALFGMGMGNVVGAPLVKKYFADRPAPMLTVFALLMQAGATIPAMLALPLAEAGGGWRFSIGSWALLSIAAAIPWAIQLARVSRERRGATATGGQGASGVARTGPSFGLGSLITNPISLGTALFYAMASLITYAMLAWMPTLLQDLGQDQGSAAAAFSLFTFMTLPLAAISPVVGSKMKNPFPYAAILAVLPAVGLIGLFAAPGLLWVWAFMVGLIGGAFPLAIAMFNRRTRTEAGSGAIAGFSMGVGYLFGTMGPLLGGWLSQATGNWVPPLTVYATMAVPMLMAAWLMCKPERYLEDKTEKATANPDDGATD